MCARPRMQRCAGQVLSTLGVLGCCFTADAIAQSASPYGWWGEVALGVASLQTDAADTIPTPGG